PDELELRFGSLPLDDEMTLAAYGLPPDCLLLLHSSHDRVLLTARVRAAVAFAQVCHLTPLPHSQANPSS
ncbi:MAG: hypothetical protein SGPRY_006552, partial [Prymnesium sp.]